MTIFDYVVLGILGFSILVGLMRGAISEFFSVLGWVFSFYLAKTYSGQVIKYLPAQIPEESIKVIAAFLIIFLTVLLVCSLISIVLTKLFQAIGLGGLNRLLGGLLGLLKGVLVTCILMMLAAMTDVPKDARWTNAMLSAPLEVLVLKLMTLMPTSITKHVHLDHVQPIKRNI